MKKIVIILLSVFLLMCCAFGLTACMGGGDDSGDNPNTEQPNNPDDGNEDDGGDGEQTNPPVTETRIAVKAYIDGSLYRTVYTTESEGYKIETPTVPEDITTNPNSERYFYGWFVDRNFQTPVTDDTTFRNDSSIYGTWIDVYSNRFEYSVNQGEATITGFNDSTATVVVVPCYLNSFPVTTIGKSAFSNKTMIRTLIICDGIETIEDYAFYNCNTIEKVELPDSLTYLSGFAYCSNLKSIAIPDSVTSIGDYAFAECSMLTSITIENSVTSIGERAFSECSGLTGKLVIPNSVTSIGLAAFEGCVGLTSITIGNGVTNIRANTFVQCSGLTSITLPDKPISIDYDFSDTAYYKDSTNWENGVLYIGKHLIKAETSLSGTFSIKPDTLSIARGAFNGCSNLTGELIIPNGVTSIGDSTFAGCTGLTSIIIPDSVTSIGEAAFYYCTGLSGELVIPDSMTSIGRDAFRECSGISGKLVIPDSVSSIGMRAFARTQLTSVIFENTTGWEYHHYTTNYWNSMPSSSLANASTAATYLTSTYVACDWRRN